VYETTCITTNKIYVGKHSTNNLDDGYLGSGYKLLNSIKKYGKGNFKRKILQSFLDEDSAYECELQLVNEDFIKRKDVLNIKVGGRGVGKGKSHPSFGKSYVNDGIRDYIIEKDKIDEYIKDGYNLGRKTKRFGDNNPAYGKPSHNKNKIAINKDFVTVYVSQIELESYLIDGWVEGSNETPMAGKSHSKETKDKMSFTRKGRPASKKQLAHLKRLGERQKGDNNPSRKSKLISAATL